MTQDVCHSVSIDADIQAAFLESHDFDIQCDIATHDTDKRFHDVSGVAKWSLTFTCPGCDEFCERFACDKFIRTARKAFMHQACGYMGNYSDFKIKEVRL